MEELKFSLNWVKKLKAFNNSLNKGVEPWEGTCNHLDTCLWGYNLKQLWWMYTKTLQWWQTWVVFELLDLLEWGLIKDLELAKLVLDFIPLSSFSNYGTKIAFDPEALEEEGLEETAYPKPILSKLGFWAFNVSSS